MKNIIKIGFVALSVMIASSSFPNEALAGPGKGVKKIEQKVKAKVGKIKGKVKKLKGLLN